MKNIHILPTDKPSRLYIDEGFLKFNSNYISENGYFINQNIYITSDEEIKEGDWFLEKAGRQYPTQWNGIEKLNFHCKKIILTDNKDLIKDGVQAIDDEFLEWFVKNPSCEFVEVGFSCRGFNGAIPNLKPIGEYKIFIPKEETKQETLEEVAERILLGEDLDLSDYDKRHILKAMLNIAKWQEQNSDKKYSEEDIIKFVEDFEIHLGTAKIEDLKTFKKWFEQFKKK